MSKKQTSIEWLAEQVKDWLPDHFNEVFEQAKAMHKEEIIESYCTGCLHMAQDDTIFPRETSENYYENTYNNTIQ